MKMIKAIETSYKGYRFRSRLEARWAVFFDAMGLDWSYETEGFTLPSGEWYLPDFKIKGDDESTIWIEVKGGFEGYLSPVDGWSKVNNFSSHAAKVNESVCVLGDIPDPNSREFIEPQKNMVISKPNGNGEWQRFCFVLNEYENKELYPSIITNKVLNGQKEVGFMQSRYRIWWPENAYRMARSSRFEHGESGAPSTPDKPRPKAAAENVAKAAQAGADQGFVSREPAARRKPGPKRTEPQGKMTIAGPDRIVQAFRAFCDARDLTLCEGVEYLLNKVEVTNTRRPYTDSCLNPINPERRTDQMSVRMRPSIRALVEQLAEEEGVPIAEVFERAVSNFAVQK